MAGRGRILVVEDEEELNDILAYNLRKAGYDVLQSFDGAEALRLVAQHAPDLVLLDVMLPGQDGWTVCRTLEAAGDTREIPIVVFTALGAREDFDLANSFSNVRGYFVKPYATFDVLRHVEKVLHGPT